MSDSLKDIMAQEYKKCATDPIYFMKKYCYIQHRERGKILFSLYKFQEKVLKEFSLHKYNIILKSRQLGISTLTSAYALHLMIFNSDKNVIVIAPTQETARIIVDMVRFMYDNLPSWLKIEATELNKLNIRLINGSQIKAKTGAGHSARGESASMLIIDEAAFVENVDLIWGSAQQTLTTVADGKAIILSTPNGVGNWFYKTWVSAQAKKNGFNTIQLHWSMHPDRDQTWRDAQNEQLGIRLAAQECFDGNTRIYTDFGLIPIKDIKVGDVVLTHNGRFMPVLNIIKKEKCDVFEIYSCLNRKKSFVTGNHPFYTKEYQWKNIENINNEDLILSLPPVIEYNNDENILDLYDLITPTFFKKILCDNNEQFYINDRKHKTLHNRFVSVDYNLGYFSGLFISEGYKEDNRVTFAFNYETELNDWPKKLLYIVEKKFGIHNSYIRNNGKSGWISFNSQVICKLLDTLISGIGHNNKHLSKFSYEVSNKEFLRGILDGIFVGDGMVVEKYNKSISITSLEAVYDIKFISSILGLSLNSMKFQNIKNVKENSTPQTILTYLRTAHIECKDRNISSLISCQLNSMDKYCWKDSRGYTDEGFLFSKIYKKVSDEKINTFNLEIEDDNSFVTEHFIVHNCDANFNTSGKNVVPLDVLDWYEKTYSIAPKEIRRNDLWIWQYPSPEKQYIVCADVARGDSENNSAFHILDLESLEQVAEYNGLMDTNDYGDLLVSISTEYNDAILVIENDGVGWAPIQRVIERGYRNLFYTTADMKYLDPDHQFTNKLYSKEKKAVAGFTTGPRTRPLIITKLETYFSAKSETERPIIRSIRLINELKTFIWDGNKAQAAHGYQDDLCMALAIGLWVRDTALQLSMQNLELNKAMLGAMTINRPYEELLSGSANIPPGMLTTNGIAEEHWIQILPTGEV